MTSLAVGALVGGLSATAAQRQEKPPIVSVASANRFVEVKMDADNAISFTDRRKPSSVFIRPLFQPHVSRVTHLAVSESGDWAASGDADGLVALWNTKTGGHTKTWARRGSTTCEIQTLAFIGGDGWLLVCTKQEGRQTTNVYTFSPAKGGSIVDFDLMEMNLAEAGEYAAAMEFVEFSKAPVQALYAYHYERLSELAPVVVAERTIVQPLFQGKPVLSKKKQK